MSLNLARQHIIRSMHLRLYVQIMLAGTAAQGWWCDPSCRPQNSCSALSPRCAPMRARKPVRTILSSDGFTSIHHIKSACHSQLCPGQQSRFSGAAMYAPRLS